VCASRNRWRARSPGSSRKRERDMGKPRKKACRPEEERRGR